MKITNISCTQFAGIRNRNVSFSDGINVIYGKNESGKSTLVNLISRTLFQNAKLDRRSDKDFFESYFPSAKKNSAIVGDFADGKITFKVGEDEYALSKEWGTEAVCRLFTPEGVIRDQSKIDELLKTLLQYGEGVYSDLLLSSQRNTDISLQTILDASKKTDAKQEIVNAVSQAFAESDGIPVDAIGDAIEAKIEEIAGKHWDLDRNSPVRKNGRWSSGLGQILKAWYTLEDAQLVLDEISRLEQAADRVAAAYAQKDAEARSAEDTYNNFSVFASRLSAQNEYKKTVSRIERERARITEILSAWPRLSVQIEKAKALQAERNDRSIADTRYAVQALRLSPEEYSVAELPCPTQAEFSAIRKSRREITALENKLCGMNLRAAIRMLGDNAVEITSLRTGQPVPLTGAHAAITEAVKITIAGVMEMQLSPADVDVAAVEAQIAEHEKIVSDILARYNASSPEALETYAQKIESAKATVESVNARISRLLGDLTMTQLEELYSGIGPVNRSAEEIEQDIRTLCGFVDVATFITKNETITESYAAEHGSLNELKAKAFDLDTELNTAREALSGIEDIPAEYSCISDPEAYLELLQNELKNKQKLREETLTEKTAAISRAEAYKDAHPEACAETVEQAQRAFDEVQSLLGHWLHIREVFLAQKENIHDNPMEDIACRFTQYLRSISDGAVESEFPETDKLNLRIYSKNNLLDYNKLSEGTKETVSLAFRLAVLDHLFPEGGGVIVLDDPFTDMDEDRTTQACKLLRECAQRHQVIFLTCRAEYFDALEGNKIRF